jgi:hypothetical protein
MKTHALRKKYHKLELIDETNKYHWRFRSPETGDRVDDGTQKTKNDLNPSQAIKQKQPELSGYTAEVNDIRSNHFLPVESQWLVKHNSP